MIPCIKYLEYLCGNTTGENVVGSERRKGDREYSGLTEWEKEHLSEMVMAMVGNGR
jgi:hypothetical protein